MGNLAEKLQQKNEMLQKENQGLKEKVQHLEDKLAKNSQNSSKPPSSDGYEKPDPKSRRKKSDKKIGGQKGHAGSTLEQVSEPDVIETHSIEVCEKCGRNLEDVKGHDHECRQEIELPEVNPVVIEHRGVNASLLWQSVYAFWEIIPGCLTFTLYFSKFKFTTNYQLWYI